jgi:thioredoxin-dependent peroxiredoxin
MLQAEIGSAKVTAAESLPTRGHLMPDFTLSSSDGKQVSLYDYRGRSNLVLFFAGRTKDSTDSPLLSALAKRCGEIAETDSEVVVVLAESVVQAHEFRRKMHFPVSVLSDPDMRVHNTVGACGAQAVPGAALYITDRFLEVFAVWRTGTGDCLPDVTDVLSWLNYLDSQCPECTQIEWPTDD